MNLHPKEVDRRGERGAGGMRRGPRTAAARLAAVVSLPGVYPSDFGGRPKETRVCCATQLHAHIRNTCLGRGNALSAGRRSATLRQPEQNPNRARPDPARPGPALKTIGRIR